MYHVKYSVIISSVIPRILALQPLFLTNLAQIARPIVELIVKR